VIKGLLASLSVAQIAILGACAVSPPDNSFGFRPGVGVIEAAEPTRVAVPRPAGGSPLDDLFRPRWTEGHQLTLRMEDGTSQQVTQSSDGFKAGDRVEVTADGRVLKAAAKAAAPAGYRTGTGVVEVVRSARVTSPSSGGSTGGAIIGSQAAGGSYGTPVERLFRSESSDSAHQVVVKMDDGTRQHVTQESDAFQPGDRVEVRADGRIVKAGDRSNKPN